MPTMKATSRSALSTAAGRVSRPTTAQPDRHLERGEQRAHHGYGGLGQQVVGADGADAGRGVGTLSRPATIQTPPATSRAREPNHSLGGPTREAGSLSRAEERRT